jgi:hypothetical protein
MERPCRKRKSASTPNEALPAGSSTPQAAPSEATRQSAKANKKRKTRNAAVTEEVDLDAVGFEELYPATIFKTPKNPRATLEGLPAELRLEIYKHLSDSSLVHVHRGTQGKENSHHDSHGRHAACPVPKHHHYAQTPSGRACVKNKIVAPTNHVLQRSEDPGLSQRPTKPSAMNPRASSSA